MAVEPEPVACTLPTTDAVDQVREWTDLRSKATSVTALANGARLVFPLPLAAQIADLAEREGACCGFLDLTVTAGVGAVVLEVTANNPDAIPVIALLAGIAPQ